MNIDEADRAVSSIKKFARQTFTPGVLAEIGSFGAMYQLAGYRKPVLVSSADGVGTKLKVAFLTGRHGTVGEDLVNHCVNDIAVQGAVPLFFLDYFAIVKLDAEVAAAVVEGIARGCKKNGCALIGGETAEMPGLYAEGEYDLAGFIVGAAERAELLTGKTIRAGDVLLGLPSTGLHTNGYSLARKLLFETAGYGPKTLLPEVGATVGDALLTVHRSYLKPVMALMKDVKVHGMAHITGGGFPDNIARILPDAVDGGVAVEDSVQRHIDTCLRCQAELARYRKMLRDTFGGAPSAASVIDLLSFLQRNGGLLLDGDGGFQRRIPLRHWSRRRWSGRAPAPS